MNLYFRLIWLILTSRLRRTLIPPFDVSRLTFRVLPNDLDVNLHMNNGRYLALMDLGRLDLILSSGLWRAVFGNKWVPIMSSAFIRYRSELSPFQRFTLESRIVFWSEKKFVMEQKFIARDRDGQPYTAAMALVRGGIYSRRDRSFVAVATLFAAIGHHGPSPEASPEVEAFIRSEESLKRG